MKKILLFIMMFTAFISSLQAAPGKKEPLPAETLTEIFETIGEAPPEEPSEG